MAALVDELLKEWKANAERWEPVARAARGAGLLVWNPGLYAFPQYEAFLRRYPPRRGAVLFMGLNPGPYGMAMTGVPFTDCRTATGELGLSVPYPGAAPKDFLAALGRGGKRLLTYERSSLVVYRFLRLAYDRFDEAFASCYFANPCPLLFLDQDGKNVTPAHPVLKRMKEPSELRLEALRRFHRVLGARGVVCLGNDVADCVGEEAEGLCGARSVVRQPHPARAVPKAWAAALASEFKARGWAP